MSTQFGYYVDTSSIQLSDPDGDGLVTGWLHALPIGTYQHPIYGSMAFTSDRVKRFADNTNAKVRGIDPDIDYDHKAKSGEAAGWVRGAEARPDGLWLQVGWTKTAAQQLKEKRYRYFSADFHDEWIDPKGAKYFDVINGGSLTNRPYLKDLMPVNLSELTFGEPEPKKEGAVDYAKMRRLLHLPDNTPDEQVDAALENRLTTQQAPPTHDPNNPPNPTFYGGRPEGAPPAPQNPFVNAAQLAELVKQLGENSPGAQMLKAMQEAQAQQTKQLAEMAAAFKLSETSRKLGEIQAAATRKGFAIAPALLDEAKAVLLSAPDALSTRVYSLLDKLADGSATVQLGEVGSVPQAAGVAGGRAGTADQGEVFDKRAKQLMETDKSLTLGDALEQAIRENPAAYAEYRRSTYLTE